MTRRTTALWLALAIAAVAATPLRAQDVGKGQWKGQARQNNDPTIYTVVLTLSDSGGASDYPELGCGGTLTRVGQSGAYSFYLETITRKGQSCIDGAVTLVKANDGTLAWGWVGTDKGETYVAWSSLTRQ
jgi:hypothetical protein